MGVVVSSLPTAGGSKGNNTSVWTVVGKKIPTRKGRNGCCDVKFSVWSDIKIAIQIELG
jgi:hypothetical protein